MPCAFGLFSYNPDKLVKSLFTCHCEESFGYAQDKLHDETIS